MPNPELELPRVKRKPWRKLVGSVAVGTLSGAAIGAILGGHFRNDVLENPTHVTEGRSVVQEGKAEFVKWLLAFTAFGAASGVVMGELRRRNERLKQKFVDDAIQLAGDVRFRAILPALTHKNPEVRIEAVQALDKLHDERAAPLLAHVVKTDNDSLAGVMAVNVLHEWSKQPSTHPLVRALSLTFPHFGQDDDHQLLEEHDVMRRVITGVLENPTRIRNARQAALYVRQARAAFDHDQTK